MKKLQLTLLILICLSSCKEDKREYYLKTIFPNTTKHQIEDKGEYVSVLIEDKNYMLDENYLSVKAQLISYQISKNNPKLEKLNIKIEKADSTIYEQLLGKELIQNNFILFNENKIYHEASKILFKEFDDSEFWNWRNSISALSKFKGNKRKKKIDFFKLLNQFSNECKSDDLEEDEINAAEYLKEGLRLINSAGMVNFWNEEEKIDQKDLLRKANRILNLCNKNPILKTDSLKIENGIHIIQSEK